MTIFKGKEISKNIKAQAESFLAFYPSLLVICRVCEPAWRLRTLKLLQCMSVEIKLLVTSVSLLLSFLAELVYAAVYLLTSYNTT